MSVASWIFLTSMAGLALSAYAYHVEMQMQEDPTYVAMCDSTWFSCTKVFASKYGHILSHFGLVPKKSVLDQPNALFGLLMYSIFLCYSILDFIPAKRTFFLIAGALMNALSVYLAYILAFVLHDFCVVCVSIYVVNAALFVLVLSDRKSTRQSKPSSKKKKA